MCRLRVQNRVLTDCGRLDRAQVHIDTEVSVEVFQLLSELPHCTNTASLCPSCAAQLCPPSAELNRTVRRF